MLARLYVLDSLQYEKQAEYWLTYAHKTAVEMMVMTEESGGGQEILEGHGLITNLKRV